MASNYYPHYDFQEFQIYRTTAMYMCPVEEHWQTQKEQPGKCDECGTELIVHEKREPFNGLILHKTMWAICWTFDKDPSLVDSNEIDLIGYYEMAGPDVALQKRAVAMQEHFDGKAVNGYSIGKMIEATFKKLYIKITNDNEADRCQVDVFIRKLKKSPHWEKNIIPIKKGTRITKIKYNPNYIKTLRKELGYD